LFVRGFHPWYQVCESVRASRSPTYPAAAENQVGGLLVLSFTPPEPASEGSLKVHRLMRAIGRNECVTHMPNTGDEHGPNEELSHASSTVKKEKGQNSGEVVVFGF